MAQDMRIAIGVSMVALLILAAGFMPWGTICRSPSFQLPFGEGSPLSGNLLQGMKLTFAVSCWTGKFPPGGIELPNWLVVLAAGAAAALCWLKVAAVWEVPAAVPLALAGYGLLHTGGLVVAMIGSDGGSVGIGLIVTVLAFIAMLAILFRAPKARVCRAQGF